MKRGWMILMLIWMGSRVQAAPPEEWTEASAGYDAGMFEETALQKYTQLKLREGTSAALEYNLGNTLMKLNRMPVAIAHYRRAQWLAPHDPDIQANLARAQTLQQAHIPDLPLGRRAAGLLPVSAWSVLLLASAWVLGVTGILRSRFNVLRLAWVWILPAGLIVLMLSTVSLVLMQPAALNSEAVAQPEMLTSRFEPLDSSTAHFSLKGGSVVNILEEVRGWTRIHVDGKTGWVPTADLIPVGFPE